MQLLYHNTFMGGGGYAHTPTTAFGLPAPAAWQPTCLLFGDFAFVERLATSNASLRLNAAVAAYTSFALRGRCVVGVVFATLPTTLPLPRYYPTAPTSSTRWAFLRCCALLRIDRRSVALLLLPPSLPTASIPYHY